MPVSSGFSELSDANSKKECVAIRLVSENVNSSDFDSNPLVVMVPLPFTPVVVRSINPSSVAELLYNRKLSS